MAVSGLVFRRLVLQFLSGLCGVILALATGLVSTGLAQPVGSFEQFVVDFEHRARSEGISHADYVRAMAGVSYDGSIARLISGQPEFTTPIWDYIDRRVSRDRISRGQAAIAANRELFEHIGARYRVDPFILAAIWGIETDYGAVLGNRSLIRPILPSLATLAFERRGRVALDEAELIAALRLVADYGRDPADLLGSWAGAMGHLQVNPSVMIAHGTDGDGNGVIDLHGSLADALATSATLLNSFGYKSGSDWGFEVEVPHGFDLTLASRNQLRPVSFFVDRGVVRVSGREFQDLHEPVFLYLPTGQNGPKFLMTANYLVLKDYNFSDSYALSVAHLTDRLKGAATFVTSWPRQTRFPNLDQRIAIQEMLRDLRFYTGDVDGRIGPITQQAYQQFQLSEGHAPDGFVTLSAYELLRAARGR